MASLCIKALFLVHALFAGIPCASRVVSPPEVCSWGFFLGTPGQSAALASDAG